MQNYYEEKNYITSAMCDTKFLLSISGILDLFQNAQTEHTEIMHVDAPTMRRESNAFWVLTKYQLRFHEIPAWRQKITVKTWPSPISLVKAERQLQILDEDRAPLVSAKAEWCCLDCDTRKIRKLSTISSYPFDMDHISEKVWEGGFTSIPEKLESNHLKYSLIVKYSHLDFNSHVNNVKYVALLQDCYSAEFWENIALSEFEIIYLNEAHEGDELDIYSRIEGKRITFLIKEKFTQREICKALIVTK